MRNDKLLLAGLALVVLPVLYVLSMGPAYGSRAVSPGTYNRVYRPVIEAANGTWCGDVLRTYVNLWKS